MVNELFAKWAVDLSGCDGGDIGTPENPSVWWCGIEWGGGFEDTSVDGLHSVFKKAININGYENYETNFEYPFNWNALKLLSVIEGYKLEDYKIFGQDKRPFVIGEKGYFKMNLFPLAFKNTSHQLWAETFANATGFENKGEYLNWIRENRFRILREMTKKHCPKLIVCTGITLKEDFVKCFTDNLMLNEEEIDDKSLFWVVNNNGSLVVIIPFMVNRYGLIRNVSITKFGQRVSELLELSKQN